MVLREWYHYIVSIYGVNGDGSVSRRLYNYKRECRSKWYFGKLFGTILVLVVICIFVPIYVYRGNERKREREKFRFTLKQGTVFELKAPEVQLCGTHKSLFPRVLQPTVPRSGNTFSRFLLENLTGIATEAVYRERGEFSNKSKAYGRPCGITGDCDKIHRSSDDELVVIKTHFPFMSPEFDEKECVSKILMTIRHPVDNYIAWASYKGKGSIKTLAFRKQMNLGKYFELWEAHHNYWHAFASRRKVPLLQYRYEDLCQHPEAVFKKVSDFLTVEFKGNYNHSSKFEDCFLKNRALPKAASLISQRDLDAVAASTSHLLNLFGYQQNLRTDTLLIDRLRFSLEKLSLDP